MVLSFFRRVRNIAKSDYYLRHVRLSVRLCPSASYDMAPTGRILMKFDIFRKSVEIMSSPNKM